MAMTALEIYKLLPKTNCKECGQATCLAFAMQIAAGKASVDACPTASDAAKGTLGAAAAPPLPKIVVGTGHAQVVMGDEVVLYRHEKTFYHPTAISLSISDALADDAVAGRLATMRALSFDRVGQTIGTDLVAIRFESNDPARFVAVATQALVSNGLPLVLMGTVVAIEAALAIPEIVASRPILWLSSSTDAHAFEAVARLSAATGLPLVVAGNGVDGVRASLLNARGFGAKDLVGAPLSASIADTVAASVSIRTKAITKTDRDIAVPTAFDLGSSFPGDPFAAACILVAKYASLLVVDDATPEFILPLLTLRQNLFTDPQKPIQVEAANYPVGKPGAESPVVVTTNFSLTFFTVRSDIEASKVPTHLLIAECDGMSVLTAWAAGKFTGESIAKMLKESGIEQTVVHRTVIIPGLVARLSGKIEEVSGWKVVVGPQESTALPAFLRRLPPDLFVPASA